MFFCDVLTNTNVQLDSLVYSAFNIPNIFFQPDICIILHELFGMKLKPD